MVKRVATSTSVAESDIEVAVWTDHERASVVVSKRLGLTQDRSAFTAQRSALSFEGLDTSVTVSVGEIGVQPAIAHGDAQ